MSILVKIFAMAIVIIVCIVFIIALTAFINLWVKWMAKGVNPMSNFPRNRKSVTLSHSQQQALNVGAILAEVNSDFCNSLTTSKGMAVKNTIGGILAKDWEINSPQDAVEALERLKNTGHRQVLDIVLKNTPEVLSPAHSFENVRQIYDQVGMSLLDKRILEDYHAGEVALVEKHIDLLFNASSDEELDLHKGLFGDDETFLTCKRIYWTLSSRLIDYVSYIRNLKQTLPELQKRGVVGDGSELARLSVAAWDMGRMVNVARYSYDCGYISESQAWEYIFFAVKKSAACYADWAAFGKAYVIGRAMWGGSNTNLSVTINTVERLQENEKSPWMLAPLN